MKKNILIYILGLMLSTSLCFAIVGHSAGQISSGTFGAGNYIFSGIVTAANFSGDGSAITSVKAPWSEITGMPVGFSDGTDDSDSIWSESGSDTYRSSGNVGIGTTNPASKFEVIGGNVTFSALSKPPNGLSVIEAGDFNAYKSTNFKALFSAWSNLGNSQARVKLEAALSGDVRGKIGTETTHSFGLMSDDTVRMTIDADGDVGIGTTSPSSKLQVETSVANANVGWFTNSADAGDSFGIGIKAGGDSTDATLRLYDRTGSNSYMYVRGDGNVGIGTASPYVKLDVNDDSIRVRTSTSKGNCATGEIGWDSDEICVCTSSNSWKCANIS